MQFLNSNINALRVPNYENSRHKYVPGTFQGVPQKGSSPNSFVQQRIKSIEDRERDGQQLRRSNSDKVVYSNGKSVKDSSSQHVNIPKVFNKPLTRSHSDAAVNGQQVDHLSNFYAENPHILKNIENRDPKSVSSNNADNFINFNSGNPHILNSIENNIHPNNPHFTTRQLYDAAAAINRGEEIENLKALLAQNPGILNGNHGNILTNTPMTQSSISAPVSPKYSVEPITPAINPSNDAHSDEPTEVIFRIKLNGPAKFSQKPQHVQS